jgi:hypothetical protein
MMQGKRNKAERGELFAHLPRGFVRTASGGVAVDPDEQVQAVMRLFFEKFEALGSGRKLLRWFLDNEVRLPVRPSHGPDRGELQWRRATPGATYRILHHPMYAGAYSYGRHPTDPRRKIPGRPGSGKRTAPMEEWQVLKQDHLPAYISWEQYSSNLRRLAENASRFTTKGAVREGEALWGGLVACGRCGYRMMVVYNEKVHQGRYVCRASEPMPGLACQSVQSKVVDQLVGGQVLRALEPAALELSLKAAEELDREYQRLDEHWQKRLERAAYEAERARRQYHAVEPENRLVARELEKRWEETLCEQRKVEEAYARFQRGQTRTLAAEERERILSLSSDIAAPWEAPSTTPADRKTILRCLVECVQIHVPERGDTEELGRLRRLRDYRRADPSQRYPAELTAAPSLSTCKRTSSAASAPNAQPRAMSWTSGPPSTGSRWRKLQNTWPRPSASTSPTESEKRNPCSPASLTPPCTATPTTQ